MPYGNRKLLLAGILAGAVNGLLGAGGGMILVPMLTMSGCLEEREIFPASVCIILPVCLISLAVTGLTGTIAWQQSLPWLTGSAAGGVLAGLLGRRIPAVWLHRGLGILILWGGIRNIC